MLANVLAWSVLFCYVASVLTIIWVLVRNLPESLVWKDSDRAEVARWLRTETPYRGIRILVFWASLLLAIVTVAS